MLISHQAVICLLFVPFSDVIVFTLTAEGSLPIIALVDVDFLHLCVVLCDITAVHLNGATRTSSCVDKWLTITGKVRLPRSRPSHVTFPAGEEGGLPRKPLKPLQTIKASMSVSKEKLGFQAADLWPVLRAATPYFQL